MRGLLGLSIGATQLAAARPDGSSILRRAELPWRGTLLTGFVERVGDPVPIVAPDGSAHSADRLLAAAVTDLVAVAGRAGERFAVAVPAHWPDHVVGRVRTVLPDMTVTSDATAALVALRAHPGLPSRGVVALCDFGATGTSVTLADAARDFAPIAPTLRFDEFSGDLIDRAVLAHLLADADVDPANTSAVASLTTFRDHCRRAKERLSHETATGLPGPVGSTVRLTRTELDGLLGVPVDGLLLAIDDQLRRAGVRPAELVAVATVGGGARIPFVTQRLSEALRTPVTTSPDAQTVAAIGAAMLAGREPETATRVVAAPGTSTMAAPAAASAVPQAEPALAWSQAGDFDEFEEFDDVHGVEWARPEVAFQHVDDDEPVASLAWYRRPAVLFAAAACAALAAAAGLVVTMDADTVSTAAASPITSVTSQSPASASSEVLAAPPVTQSVQDPGPGPTVVQYTQAPAPRRPAPQPQPSVVEAPPPPPPVTEPTTTTSVQPTTTTTTEPTTTTSTPTSTTTSTSTSTPTSTTTATASSEPPSSEPPSSPPSEPPVSLPSLPSLPPLTLPAAPSSAWA
ncbi:MULTISPECIES: Hsp70 family protein [unclassified Mycobacterium]|uniref:Hsp70 family protein n=1 Tax=unclassified Mycobacterium TaxID=2642494 RepID=UPI0029C8606D|nr:MULTISPECIES: Hsp70 family protein [unclassified Mycobacterium]